MTNKISTNLNGSRRNFMLAAGGAGAASLAVALLPSGGDRVAQQPGNRPAQRGYRLTPHISAYYKTARV